MLRTEYNTRHARNWRKVARTALLAAMGGCCKVCGYNRCAHAIDFHHVNASEKLDHIAALMGERSWLKVVKEARKCVLLCTRCHRELHAGFIPDITTIPLYDIPDAISVPVQGDRKFAGLFKACPVRASELRSLRTKMSFDKLAVHFKANKRTVMRWCNEMLV